MFISPLVSFTLLKFTYFQKKISEIVLDGLDTDFWTIWADDVD